LNNDKVKKIPGILPCFCGGDLEDDVSYSSPSPRHQVEVTAPGKEESMKLESTMEDQFMSNHISNRWNFSFIHQDTCLFLPFLFFSIFYGINIIIKKNIKDAEKH
jgi:hypothetical protein